MFGKNLLGALGAVALLVSSVIADSINVHALTPETFQATIGSLPALVEFYAPWCGHCKNLEPIYDQLGDAFSTKKDRVVIAKVDADAHRALGSKYDVTGYPTIKWFPKGLDGQPEDYKGGRDLDSLSAFVTSKTGVKSNIVRAVSPVTILTNDNFDELILKSKKNALVEFFAPWCGHCKKLAPIYEKVATDFALEQGIVIASVDATVQTQLAEKYGIKGYPTIKFFTADGKMEDYTSGRGEQDFVDFVNQKSGTFRAIGGALNSRAGRISNLDTIAAKLASSSGDARTAARDEGLKAANALPQASAKYYINFFNKAHDSNDYVTNESARLAKVIKSGTVNPKKLDEFAIRSNILSAFASQAKREEL